MTSLYSSDIRAYIHSRPWPPRVRWDILEFEDCLKIRLYRNNINRLNSDEKLALGSVINEALSNINGRGVPMFTMVVKGDGDDVQTGDYLFIE